MHTSTVKVINAVKALWSLTNALTSIKKYAKIAMINANNVLMK